MSVCQFTPSRLQQFRKIALSGWFRAQVMDGSTSLRNSFLRCLNCLIYDLHRVVRIAEQQFASGLKLKNRSLKTLKQCVMQLARDARSLIDSFLEAGLYTIDGKAQTQAVRQEDN